MKREFEGKTFTKVFPSYLLLSDLSEIFDDSVCGNGVADFECIFAEYSACGEIGSFWGGVEIGKGAVIHGHECEFACVEEHEFIIGEIDIDDDCFDHAKGQIANELIDSGAGAGVG